MSAKLQPWKQLPGENNEDFSRFLSYRNLGPGRTLRLAYHTFKSGLDLKPFEVDNRDELIPLTGTWAILSSQWDWPDRAHAWDVHNFETYGQRAVVQFIAALDMVTQKVCAALADPKIKPKRWQDVINALDIIQQYALPGTVTEVRTRPGNPPAEPEPDGQLVLVADDGNGS